MRRWDRVDWALSAVAAVAIVMLAGSLGWPWIEAWQQRPRPGRQVARQFVGSVERTGTVANGAPIRFDYLLYLPEDYAKESQWPLVVFLHGAGERGSDVKQVARSGPPHLVEQGQSFPFVMVCPQCAAERSWEAADVLALVEHVCDEWRVDRQRVYLMGYSMGAFGTWRTAVAAPEEFAAIVPVAGGGEVGQAGRLVGLPIRAFHGDSDETVSLKSSQEMVDAVRTAGGNARLAVYEHAGHGILQEVCNDPAVWDWLLSQRREQRGETSR